MGGNVSRKKGAHSVYNFLFSGTHADATHLELASLKNGQRGDPFTLYKKEPSKTGFKTTILGCENKHKKLRGGIPLSVGGNI